MYIELETDRLLIRPITIRDHGFILTLVNTPGWLKFIGDRNVRNILDAESYIQKIISNKNFFYHVFEIKEIGQPIGIITFLKRDNQEFPDIGFALLPEFEKQGYTYEAARKYLDEIISRKLSRKVIGITVPDNENSIKLLKKLGLEFQHDTTKNGETISLFSMALP